MKLFKKILLGLSLLVLSIAGFSQENQPATQLAAEGITFNAGDYDIPEYTDATYTTVYYFDYTSGLASNDGLSAVNPKKSPSDLTINDTISLTNTAFLLKRDEDFDEGSKKIRFVGDNILLGAYGVGDRPKLNLYNFYMNSSNITLRDIHVYNTNVSIMDQHDTDSLGFIYNCEISRETGWGGSVDGGLFLGGSKTKVIYNTIHGMLEDGLYWKDIGLGNVNSEVAYNYVYDVSRQYFDGEFPSGDCLQFNSYMDLHIHHNVLDRSTTPNKFDIILSAVPGDPFWGTTPMRSIIEYNIMYMPAAGLGYGGAGLYIETVHTCIAKYNKIIGGSGITCIYKGTTGGLEAYGNIVTGGGSMFRAGTGDKFYNNTFYNNSAATGDPANVYAYNNIFENYDSNLDNGTNLFADIEGWGNLVTDASNDDFSLIPSSPAINAATWDGSNMDSDFTEDMEGTAVPHSSGNFDIGALQYAVAGACDGINIYFNGTASPDTAGRGIGSIYQAISGNGTSPYTFLWNDSNTSEDRTGLTSGTYSVTITDDNSCTNDTSYVINNITSTIDGNVTIDSVYATDWQDPNVPDNILDNNNLTRLSSDDNSATLTAYISETSQIDSFSIYFDNATRVNNGAVQCYYDGNPQGVVNFSSDSLGVNLQYFSLNQVADSLVFYLLGNNQSLWTSWNELDLFGSVYTPPTTENNWLDSLTTWLPFNNNVLDTFDINDGTASSITYSTGYDGKSSGAINTTNNGYVLIDDLNFGIADLWTISWRMYPTATYKTFANYDSDNYIKYNNGTLHFSNDGTDNEFPGSFPINSWYMLTLVARSDNYLMLYSDTTLIDSVELNDNAFQLTHIGGISTRFDGYIDNFMIADGVAFDSNGVKAIYNDFPTTIVPCDTTTIVTEGVITNVDCYAANTGKVTTSTIGGVTPYTYLWSSGETVDSIYNKPAGEYSITVTDDNGCVGVQSFTITQPDFSVVNGEYTNPTCYGYTDGTAAITITGGTAPWVVYWDSLGIYGTSVTNIGDNQGYYTATDANGCVLNGNTSTFDPDPIVDNYDNISKDYDNKQYTGTIFLNPSGGTGQLTYEWNNGYTNYDRTGLRPGGYTISITDDNGCVVTYDFIIKYVYSPYNKTKAKITGKKALIKDGKIKR